MYSTWHPYVHVYVSPVISLVISTNFFLCEGGVIPGTFGAELAKRQGSSSMDKDSRVSASSNHYHRRDSTMEEGGEEDDQEGGVSGNVEELFAGSLLPPVQLPLDYSTHVKQRTLVASTAKTVKKIKQERVNDMEEMDTSESGGVSTLKHVHFAKPVKQPTVSEVKSHRVTAAELFTPSEVHSFSNLA